MERDDICDRQERFRRPWWLKAVFFSFGATVVLGVMLGLTDYPTEEWPFVAGVVGVVLFLSSLVVSIILLVAAKLLTAYRRAVITESGLNIEVEDAKVAAHVGLALMVSAVIMLLYVAAVWGVALLVALAVLGGLGLPSFASDIHAAALALVVVGGGGLVALTVLSFGVYFLIGRMVKGTLAATWAIRLVLNVVHGVERRAQGGALGGSSVRV